MSSNPIGSTSPYTYNYTNRVDDAGPTKKVDSTGSGVGGDTHTHAPPTHAGGGGINRSIDITGGGSTTSGTSGVDLDDAKTLIAKLEATPPSEIMALAMAVVEEASAASREAQEQALNMSNQAVAQLMAQAGTLRQEAGQMMAGAVASLVMTCVSSAISVVGAVKAGSQLSEMQGSGGASNTAGDEKVLTESPKPTVDPESTENVEISVKSQQTEEIQLKQHDKNETIIQDQNKSDMNTGSIPENTEEETKALTSLEKATKSDQMQNLKLQQIQNTSTLYQAFSQVAGAFGNFANSAAQSASKLTEAEGDEDAAEAQKLQGYAQQFQTIAQDLGKTVDQIISAMQSIQQTQADMMRTMTKV